MAVVFDKDLTFRQRMAQYDKESLKVIAGNLGLRKLSKLRKAELVERIAEHVLNPEVFFYRAAILSDKEIALIEKGSNGPVSFSDQDHELVCRLNDQDFVALSHNEYLIPCDVVETLQKIRTPEFETYRKRASWVWMCVKFAEQFYGYTPMENMLNLINCKKGFEMTEQELIDIFDHFPEEHLWTMRIEDIFLELCYADDMEKLRALRTVQANKDFYIPSVDEVVEFYETDALLSDKPYQVLIRFLERELGLEYVEAADMMYELWDMLSSDNDPHEAMQWFWNQFEFENKKQVEKMVSHYMAVANGTRMLSNRGHKPMEMYSKTKFCPGHMSTIQEGVSEKKVYPNDPCPCGSGKKYKKCCGR